MAGLFNFTPMQIDWILYSFNTLTPAQLYAIMKLRSRIFVVEQNCVYLDADDKDASCFHLCAWHGELLVAYTRLVPLGISYTDYPSIGRVVAAPEYRGLKLGRKLMEKSIEHCLEKFGFIPIKISAQIYLNSFYSSLSFMQTSQVYLEDNIEHIEMIYYPK